MHCFWKAEKSRLETYNILWYLLIDKLPQHELNTSVWSGYVTGSALNMGPVNINDL